MPGAWLALDLGTTSARALLVHADGRVLARAQRRITTRYPQPGRVEQDPEELWQASLECGRAALAAAGVSASEVACLGIATQRSSALAWDARTLAPLAPLLGWQDRRTIERCAELRRQGLPIDTLAAASRLEWLVRECPAVRAAADVGRLRLGTPDAWLSARLCEGKVHVTDPGQAGATALYDYGSGCWSPPLLSVFGLEAEWLPALHASSEVVAESSAAHFGSALPLAARAGDQQAACFAQGVHRSGLAKLTLGTSAMCDVHTGAQPVAAGRGTYPLPLWKLGSSPREFCVEGTVVTAGAAVDWLVSAGLLAEPAALDALARRVPSSEGAVFVPALQGLGTPHLDPAARGLIGGLTRGTTTAHVARALVDGLAQRLVDVLDEMPAAAESAIRVDGGLAACDLLLQELADMSGRRVERAAERETTALGAAGLAALAVGALDVPSDLTALLEAPAVFEPEIDAGARARARRLWQRALDRCTEGGARP